MNTDSLPLRTRLLQQSLLSIRPAFIASALKRILRIGRITVRTNADLLFSVDPISNFGATLIRSGEYEPGMYQTLQTLLKPAGIFIDCGANEGYFTVIAAKVVSSTGQVIAIEPQARLRSVIERNCGLNNVKNVTLVDAAISDQEGVATLYVSPDTNTGSTALQRSTKYRLPTASVTTTTLSNLLLDKKIAEVDLLKMDIEGFEYEAILGSPEIFKEQRIKALALELHPNAIKNRNLNPQHIIQFLADCKYHRDRSFTNEVWRI